MVERLGGGVLELVAAKVDANQLFGNPLPGKKKELRVRYLVVVRRHISLYIPCHEKLSWTCGG